MGCDGIHVYEFYPTRWVISIPSRNTPLTGYVHVYQTLMISIYRTDTLGRHIYNISVKK